MNNDTINDVPIYIGNKLFSLLVNNSEIRIHQIDFYEEIYYSDWKDYNCKKYIKLYYLDSNTSNIFATIKI